MRGDKSRAITEAMNKIGVDESTGAGEVLSAIRKDHPRFKVSYSQVHSMLKKEKGVAARHVDAVRRNGKAHPDRPILDQKLETVLVDGLQGAIEFARKSGGIKRAKELLAALEGLAATCKELGD